MRPFADQALGWICLLLGTLLLHLIMGWWQRRHDGMEER